MTSHRTKTEREQHRNYSYGLTLCVVAMRLHFFFLIIIISCLCLFLKCYFCLFDAFYPYQSIDIYVADIIDVDQHVPQCEET